MLASDVGREVGSVINLSVRGRWIGRVYRVGRRRTEDESPLARGGERIQAGASEHRERRPCVDVKGQGAQGTCGDRER